MERYTRQMILPSFGKKTQQKLSNSKVLIVGVGGLGVPVAQYLVAAGVGHLGIVDGDTVELSNLHRQVIYSEENIGQKKALISKKILSNLNSEINIESYPFYLDKEKVFELIEKYDIIVDCTDDFAIRFLLNDVCFISKKPLVFASIFRYEAQMSVFHYGKNPFNLRDIFPKIPAKDSVPNCSEAGVLGVLASIVGSFQAMEVIKIIGEIGEVCSGKLMLYNSLNHQTQFIKLSKNPNAFLAHTNNEIMNYDYNFACNIFENIETLEDLEKLLQQKNTVLIDVRNKEELPRIKGFSVLEIPLIDLILSFEKIKNHEKIIFTCQSGIRSIKAIELTSEKHPNKQYFNLKEGIKIFDK